MGGPWTYLAEPGALVEVEPGAGCRPGCDQPAATVVADPGVGAAAVCTAHTGWATPAAYLPSVLPTVADILGAPVEPVEVDAVELRDRRSIAQRIGIGDQLAHEIDTAVNYPGSAPAGGYTILPDGEAARELYPVESAALAWVHDMVWRQCRPVTIGALRDQLARLRAELAQPAEAAPGRSVPLAATTRGPSVVVSPDFAAYAAGELPADRLRCALCGHAPCGCPPFGTPAYLALVDQVHGHARASAHDDGRPAIYLPSGLTRDGWPEGAGPDPIGCRPIAAGPADPTGHPSDRLRGRYFLGSRLGRLHVWLDDIWRGHTRDLDVVTVWLMRHGATRVDLIREQCAGLIAEWEATSMLGQHVTWAVGDGYRYGWVEPRHLDDDTPTGIVSVLHVTGTVYRVPVRELDRTGEATAPEWAAGQPCRWLPGCERPSVAQYQHPRRGPVDICGPCRVMATGATG